MPSSSLLVPTRQMISTSWQLQHPSPWVNNRGRFDGSIQRPLKCKCSNQWPCLTNFDNGGTVGLAVFWQRIFGPQARKPSAIGEWPSFPLYTLEVFVWCTYRGAAGNARQPPGRDQQPWPRHWALWGLPQFEKSFLSETGNRTGNKLKSHLQRCGRGTPQKICEDPQSASDVQGSEWPGPNS